MGRNLKLTDQGNIQFFEGTGGGVNKITLQAAATLTADYTLTWPDNDGDADQFLKTNGSGVMTWANSTATLQSSYDNGGKITTASAVPVEIEVGAASANVALLLDQDDDFKALDITKDGTGAGDAIAVLNSGTGRGLFLDQDGAAVGLEIDQDGAAVAFSLNQATDNIAIDVIQAGDAVGINLLKSGTGAGNALAVENDGTGIGLLVNQDGAAIAIQVDQATDNIAIEVTQAGNADGIAVNKTGTGGGDAIDINNDGTGRALVVDNSSSGTNAIDVIQAAAQVGVRITQSGENLALLVDKTASGAITAAEIQDAGTGICLLIDKNANGEGIRIDSEATSEPLLRFAPLSANTRGDISFGVDRVAAPTTPSEGDLWYDGTAERFEIQTGTGLTTLGTRLGSTHFGVLATNDIASGSYAINSGFSAAGAQADTSPVDDLDTITSLAPVAGDVLVIKADAGDTITVKHNTGNIHLDGSADKALVNGNQLSLMFDGTDWTQLTPMMVLP